MYERKPTLHCVRVAAGNASFPWTIEPLLDICDEKKRGRDKVVEENGGDALVIILRTCRFLVDK